MTAITFAPRILYLSQSLEAVRVQLAGVRLTRAAASPLRDDISTDEISPLPIMVHFDETLGRYPYTGYTVAGHQPIGVGAIQQAQIEKIKSLKASRDNTLAQNCLAAIAEAINAEQNIMPPVIAAVEANCTLGEISDVLRNIFGEYQA